MWFRKKKIPIAVFSRQCFISTVSQHKQRLPGFSHEVCYQNLLSTIDLSLANLTFFYDGARGELKDHYLSKNQKYPVIEVKAGTESGSFLALLDHLKNSQFAPDTVIYIVEDDYLHKEGWCDVLLEAFQIPGIDYVTLYDHRDKYRDYPELRSQIFHTKSAHFRTTPSTTNTFAVRYRTLMEDLACHRQFSECAAITEDHQKFCALQSQGRVLISSLPGFSTHVDAEFYSPCVDWKPYFLPKKDHICSL